MLPGVLHTLEVRWFLPLHYWMILSIRSYKCQGFCKKIKKQLTFNCELLIMNKRHRDVSKISEELLIQEKYSSGWRGAPAKGVDRLRGARVQIPPSPFTILKIFFLCASFLKKHLKNKQKRCWQKEKEVVRCQTLRWKRRNNRRWEIQPVRELSRRSGDGIKKMKKVLDKPERLW